MSIPRGFVKFRRDAVGPAIRDRIKQALTIVPLSTSSYSSDKELTIRIYAEDGDYIGVPRGFFNEKLRGRYIDDFEFLPSLGGNDLRKATPITPRDGQEELISKSIAVMKLCPFGGVIMEAATAAGKTVLGIETARRLGLKVLIVVHSTVLAEQWQLEIAKFFPTWRVGRLQGDKIDIRDKDVVIGMLQSLSLKDYERWVYDEFGTMVIDEVHKSGAPEFAKVLNRFTPKYIVGLSGTIQRADRAEQVFIHGIGRIVSGMSNIKVLLPRIYFIDTSFSWFGDDDAPLDRQKGSFLKDICTSDVRNEIIVKQTAKAAQAGRNVLVLSERVAHIEILAARLKKVSGVSVGVMVGTSKKKEREEAQEAQIICATVQLVGTGFNVPRLDTLVFATPIQDVVQPVGRIRRHHPNKKTPFVLDLVDSNSRVAMRLGLSRKKKYLQAGWGETEDKQPNMFGAGVFAKHKKF